MPIKSKAFSRKKRINVKSTRPFLTLSFIFVLLSQIILAPLFFTNTAHASYENTILDEGNALLYYWPMNEGAGATSLAATKGGTAINLTGATAGEPGKIEGTAISFNGTSNSAQTASSLDLTAFNKLVVEALVYIPSYTNTGRTLWEFSPNVTNTPPDTFMFNIDGGVGGSEATSNVALQGNGGYSIATYTRPTAGNWHHLVTVYNKGLSTNEVDFYIDGVLQSATRPYNKNNTNNFGNRVLYLMARGASTSFAQGKMQHLAIYSDLSEAKILAHANLLNTASSVTLTGPTTGLYSASSTPFTVGANGNITGSIVVTPNDGGVSGVFNPTSVTISSETPTATFTYYPITTGARNISVTNDGGLTNPSSILYQVVAPATEVTLSGPTTGSNGIATSQYTIGTDNLVSSDVVVTPDDDGAGGIFTPSSITITTINTTGTFTYTPASVGSKTISITNDGGLTNPSSITLVVSAAPAYQSTILTESTLLNYWPMTESSGTNLTALAGGVNINLNGATVGAPGKVGGTAVSFNGTSNSAQTASSLDLTAYEKVVVEALLYFNAYDNTFRSAWELGPSAISTGFGFAYDGGTGRGDTSNIYHNGPAGYNLALYTRPTVATWHHIVTVYDRGLETNEVNFYIDGILQTPSSRPFDSNNTNNFGNDILYLMGRGGNSAYGNGKMQHLAIYSDLSEAKILAHANLLNTASSVTLTGPTSGINGSTSTNFTVGSDLPVTSSIVVTPNDNGGGGTFTPSTLIIGPEIPTATFTYTPASVGSKTISVANDGGLSNPSSITYTVMSNTPATTVSFSGPTGGSINTNSTNFTVSTNGLITGNLIVTPNDNGDGGIFTPSSVTINSGTPTATFVYSPSSLGEKIISITNNQSLINNTPVNYLVLMVGSGLVLGDSTVATYAGGTQIASFIYTEEQINDGWQVTNIAVPGHTIAQQKAVYLSTASRSTVDFTISQIGLNDMNPAEASSVAIARLQDLINTINSNKKIGALTIISTMIPCRQRYIDVYGATNGPIAWQKFLEINEAIKGYGPNPITGVDYRISDHFALLEDGNGNLNPIYDTGDHIHQNNAARQINARVWRDSLAMLNLLSPDVPSAPIIGSATAGNNGIATVTFLPPQFNGGAVITGYTIASSPVGGIDSNAGSTNLTHTITGLTDGQIYTFNVTATNSAGISTSSASSNQVITTDTNDPIISSILSTSTNTSSTLTWTTNEESSSIVDYGLTNSYGNSTTEPETPTRVTSHIITISGLVSCTTYYYRVRSTDLAQNEAMSFGGTFTTLGCTGSAAVEAFNTGTITSALGGSIDLLSDSKGISLAVPASFSELDANFQIKQLNKISALSTTSTPTGSSLIGSYIYELKALPDISTLLSSFNNAVTVSFTYGSSDISGINEDSLGIYRWDGSNWNRLTSCSENTSTKTISCTTTAFSVFGLFGQASNTTTIPFDSSNNNSSSINPSSNQTPLTTGSWSNEITTETNNIETPKINTDKSKDSIGTIDNDLRNNDNKDKGIYWIIGTMAIGLFGLILVIKKRKN